ncbi:MAG: hypothetical protein EON96_00940, partial [Caulobacteraceae bacterium]
MPKDNRILIAIGAAAAVVIAVIVGLLMTRGGDSASDASPPAAQGGLTVSVADAPGLDSTRELRCYVDGQFVGMATLTDCARRNGLATDALDVGVDATGALVAAPTASLTPPPIAPPTEMTENLPEANPADSTQSTQPASQSGGQCMRYTGSDWRTVSSGGSLNQCVQELYAGTCVRPGEALYGRWGETTLRLVPRRVEQSPDNNRFRTLA